jgi:hypothetical protein
VAEANGAENPDPRKATQITILGNRRTGKSELGYVLFDSYPFDRIAVDPPGDLKMPEDTLRLDTVPPRWPGAAYERAMGERKKRQTLYYPPDFHSPTYLQDMDDAVGLAYAHGNCCLLFDEVHELAQANRTPPHMRRMLRQGRHRNVTTIYMTQRPLTIDPLIIAHADYLYIFKLRNPADRKRVAESMGWDQRELDAALAELGQYEYLRFQADATGGDGDLAHFPALPSHMIRGHSNH